MQTALKLGAGASAAIGVAFSGAVCAAAEPHAGPPPELAVRRSIEASALEGVTVQVRDGSPTLLTRPLVRAVVRDACIALHGLLGRAYSLVLEETTDPEEINAEPRLHVLVRVTADDDSAMRSVDRFISERWVREPVEVRRLVRIGCEFI